VIHYRCKKCSTVHSAQDHEAGSKVNCPACGQGGQVPTPPTSKAAIGKRAEIPQPSRFIPSVIPVKPAAAQWYYCRDGKRLGPLADGEVFDAIDQGKLRSNDQVWRQGLAGWELASKHFAFTPQQMLPVKQTPSKNDEILEVIEILDDDYPEVPKVVPVPVSNSDERPPLDPSGRFYMTECATCQRLLRTPIEKRGCISQCPTCRLYFRVWGRPRRGVADGLPITVRVSAFLFQWPTACACCLGPHDDLLKVKHYRSTNFDGG
jgi:hypothetical protein